MPAIRPSALPLWGLLRGMSVTLRNFFRRAVTKQYPEEPMALLERFRGRLFLDPNICTGCTMCEQACPNGALVMVPAGEISNTAHPQNEYHIFPRVDIAMCTYCGWCEDACPTSAIRHTQQFELARYDRLHFIYSPEALSMSEEALAAEPEKIPPQLPGEETPLRPSDEPEPIATGGESAA